jgi:hypothetical protein
MRTCERVNVSLVHTGWGHLLGRLLALTETTSRRRASAGETASSLPGRTAPKLAKGTSSKTRSSSGGWGGEGGEGGKGSGGGRARAKDRPTPNGRLVASRRTDCVVAARARRNASRGSWRARVLRQAGGDLARDGRQRTRRWRYVGSTRWELDTSCLHAKDCLADEVPLWSSS